MLARERFTKSCYREAVDRPPVWLMRQAGRHLPEYAELRARHPFLEMLTTEKLIWEISLQPWRRYQMDAVIVFSDILLLPMAMGMELLFLEGQGPKFSKLIESEEDLKNLKSLSPKKDIPFLLKALKKIKKEIGDDAALIGFAGSPWTVASYMASPHPNPPPQGGRETNLFPSPLVGEGWGEGVLKQVLEKLTQKTIVYLQAQIDAGVDAIQIFDSWGGALPPQEYMKWSGNYIKEIVQALKPPHPHPPPPTFAKATAGKQGGREIHLSPSPLVGEGWGEGVPIILYIKDSQNLLAEMLATGCDVVSIGWETSLEEAKKLAQGKAAIQGNFNPHILMQAKPEEIRQQTLNMLKTMEGYPGYIANLGHGVLPKTPVENVEAFVETVKSIKYQKSNIKNTNQNPKIFDF